MTKQKAAAARMLTQEVTPCQIAYNLVRKDYPNNLYPRLTTRQATPSKKRFPEIVPPIVPEGRKRPNESKPTGARNVFTHFILKSQI